MGFADLQHTDTSTSCTVLLGGCAHKQTHKQTHKHTHTHLRSCLFCSHDAHCGGTIFTDSRVSFQKVHEEVMPTHDLRLVIAFGGAVCVPHAVPPTGVPNVTTLVFCCCNRQLTKHRTGTIFVERDIIQLVVGVGCVGER